MIRRDRDPIDDYLLYGGTPPHEHVDTSREAAEKIRSRVGPMQKKVLAFLEARGHTGATDSEIERGLYLLHQTASARRRELVLKNLVAWTGTYRITSSGRRARVWRSTKQEETNMSLIASSASQEDWTPCPEGLHIARCCWLVDLGQQISKFGGVKPQVLIGWELPTQLIPDGKRAGEPYFFSRRFTKSLWETAALRLVLEAWRGKAFTEGELSGFDLSEIVDRECNLQIIHEEKEGKKRAKILSVRKYEPAKQKCPPRINPLRVFNLEHPDQEILSSLPEWVQKIVAERVRDIEHHPLEPKPEEDTLPF